MPKRNRQQQQQAKQGPKSKALTSFRGPAIRGATFGRSAYSIKSSGPETIRVTGHELLGPINPGGPSSGAFTFFDLNPACWTNSRLALLAQTYEKYRYSSVVLHYVPIAGTSSVGSVGVYVETDVNDAMPTGGDQQILGYIMQQGSSVITQVAHEATLKWKVSANDRDFYRASTGENTDIRYSTQCMVVGYSSANTTVPGFLVIQYEMDLMYPELELSSAGTQFTGQVVTTPAEAGNLSAVGSWGGAAMRTGDVYQVRVAGTPSAPVQVSLGNSTDVVYLAAGMLLWAATYAVSGVATTFLYRSQADALAGSPNALRVQSGFNTGIALAIRKIFSASLTQV